MANWRNKRTQRHVVKDSGDWAARKEPYAEPKEKLRDDLTAHQRQLLIEKARADLGELDRKYAENMNRLREIARPL